MSFEAGVAKSGNYHDADVDAISDERNWPRKQPKQNSQQVADTTKNEEVFNVVESDDDAIADNEDVE